MRPLTVHEGPDMSTVTVEDKNAAHTARLGKLVAARAEEKEARRLRREGRDEEAIEAYDHARNLYVDTDLAFHDRGESDLADEVQRAIERCNKIRSNIRHPKEMRAPATTPRPDCLSCGKPLRRFKWEGAFNDGTPREWGDYGDQRFCGLRCGWAWACLNAPMPRKVDASRVASTSTSADRASNTTPSKPSRKTNP